MMHPKSDSPRVTNWRDLLRRVLELRRMARFAAVGLIATLLYVAVTIVAGNPPLSLSPMASNALGVAISLAFSYFGHHRFTFDLKGGHQAYLLRFIASSLALFVVSSLAMALGCHTFKIDQPIMTVIIAVCYPAMSYLIALLWTFAHKA